MAPGALALSAFLASRFCLEAKISDREVTVEEFPCVEARLGPQFSGIPETACAIIGFMSDSSAVSSQKDSDTALSAADM